MPLLVLLVDFYYNCIPIVWRHFMVSMTLALGYAVFIMSKSLGGTDFYKEFDYKTWQGWARAAGVAIWTIGVQCLLVCWHEGKMHRADKNVALTQLKKMKEALRFREEFRRVLLAGSVANSQAKPSPRGKNGSSMNVDF